jgi:formylmethanofuran dehydrogenase subunit D
MKREVEHSDLDNIIKKLKDTSKEIDEVAILKVESGDTIIFRTNLYMTETEYARLKEEILKQLNLPEGVKVCIIEKCDGIYVLRPEKQTDVEILDGGRKNESKQTKD